ncbi:MAG: choice-of-anchor D domain-containing protein [Solirubrobacteraceae bacterium]
MRYRLTTLGFATVALALGFSGQAVAASIAPAPIDFGDVGLNTKVTVSMTVTIDSGYELDLASGAGINAPFEFSFGACSGSTCTDTESFTPTSLGPVGGTLNVFECPITSGSCVAIPVFVEGVGAYPSLDSPPTLDFGAQTTASPSAVSWLAVQSSGPAAVTITGAAQIGGPDASDFTIPGGDDACEGHTLAVGVDCFVGVRFTPAAAGPRSATLTLGASNSNPTPATVALKGTGVAPNSGPAGTDGAMGLTGSTGLTGATGATGLTGAVGPAGPTGANGEVELVTCRSAGASTSHGHSATHGKSMRCTTKLVAGPVKFTTIGTATRAALSRDGAVEATGVVSGRGGHTLLLSASGQLKAGRYTLSLTGRHGRRRTSTVTIG